MSVEDGRIATNRTTRWTPIIVDALLGGAILTGHEPLLRRDSKFRWYLTAVHSEVSDSSA